MREREREKEDRQTEREIEMERRRRALLDRRSSERNKSSEQHPDMWHRCNYVCMYVCMYKMYSPVLV